MSLLSSIASGILWCIGWNSLPRNLVEDFSNSKRVVLFSHSSYWDFVLFLLYWATVPSIMRDMYVVMKPQPFKYLGWLLQPTFIPATSITDRGLGFVDSTTRRFRGKTTFQLMISPKGTIVDAPWRSGWYYLARNLDAEVQVIGLDYRLKTVVFQPPRSLSDKDQLEAELKEDMTHITPLYTHQELHIPGNSGTLFSLNPIACCIVVLASVIIYMQIC